MATKSKAPKFTEDELKAAAKSLIAFYEGRNPSGKTDNANRWYPDSSELCTCCNSIRTPSRAWPWTLFKHCHSLVHIENVFGAKHEATLYLKRVAKRSGVQADKDIKGFKSFSDSLICANQIADLVEEIFTPKVPAPTHKSPRI